MGRWVRCGGDAASPANGIGLEGGGNDGAGGGTTAAAEGEGRRLVSRFLQVTVSFRFRQAVRRVSLEAPLVSTHGQKRNQPSTAPLVSG